MEHPTLPCPSCGQDTEFEQPVCADGHTDDGGECPEWACLQCGAAFVSGGVTPATADASVGWGRAA